MKLTREMKKYLASEIRKHVYALDQERTDARGKIYDKNAVEGEEKFKAAQAEIVKIAKKAEAEICKYLKKNGLAILGGYNCIDVRRHEIFLKKYLDEYEKIVMLEWNDRHDNLDRLINKTIIKLEFADSFADLDKAIKEAVETYK